MEKHVWNVHMMATTSLDFCQWEGAAVRSAHTWIHHWCRHVRENKQS